MLFGSSVESLVYPEEGSDKTRAQINNTPHLYMIHVGTTRMHTSDECYCYPCAFSNCQILFQG